MHFTRFSDIAAVLKVKPSVIANDPVIESLLTDSRKLLLPNSTLFFAINGPQKNASVFLLPLYEKGVRCFIASVETDPGLLKQMPEGNIILVKNVLAAIQQVAAFHRHRFHYPVIGITGSNGKTMVKEWLYQLLNSAFHIVRSPKSYNSQVGVPLSVWNMSESNTLGIFEAGISQPGEMEKLQEIIDPEIGVFTYTGDAHAEGFTSLRQKIEEKLALFVNSKVLIYCVDDEQLAEAVMDFKASVNKEIQLFGWSRKVPSELFIGKIQKKENGMAIYCTRQEQSFDFFIPFTDEASVHNAVTCCCVMLYLNIPVSSIAANIFNLRAVEMRLELKEGINNCSIINDSYSADINSLSIALDFLAQQHQHPHRTVILSDILESGLRPSDLYQRIAAILHQKGLYRLILIGPQMIENAKAFDSLPNKSFFDSTEHFLKHHASLHFHDETILLKGARVFRFEKISHVLEQKMHETVLEINLNALRGNLGLYKRILHKEVKLMAMVKAFSYGSGSYEIAGLLQHAGVDYLAVAYADEGVALRKAGIRLPIMVMNTEEKGFGNLIQFQLQPELYSLNILRSFDQYLKKNHLHDYPVHLKLDTGMYRLGFLNSDIDDLCSFLANSPSLKILSVFSHLVASDEMSQDDFTKKQAALFSKMAAEIENAIGYPFLKHIANSSAIHRHPGLQLDMVRLGIGLYGVDSVLKLQNVTTLKTTISQIKQVPKGETVGYSRKGIVERDSVIAVVRIGYADGYTRKLGNGTGKMLLNGQLAPVIGNVCMDMTMLDITGIEAAEGDEVIVFGEKLPVSKVAAWAQTIPYEILTNISQRVKRVYYEE